MSSTPRLSSLSELPSKGTSSSSLEYHFHLMHDGALLASASGDNSIKFWAFESRRLLASFDVINPRTLILSPTISTQLAYATCSFGPDADYVIVICNIPLDILSNIRIAQGQSALPKVRIYSYLPCPFNNFLWRILQDLLEVCITSFSRFVLTDLQTDATRRPARMRRNPAASPVVSFPPRPQRPLLTRDPQ
jgi:hypothetical protein